jgi:Ca2+-transporting ATPase
VETLGAATVICTDKTGTLTENAMTVRSVWTPEGSWEIDGRGYSSESVITPEPGEALRRLATAGALCNHASVEDGKPIGDPTEAALVTLAERVGISVSALRAARPILSEIPFDSGRRRMTVVTEDSAMMKGALDVVLDRCRESKARGEIELEAGAMAKRGLRVLAIASKPKGGDPERALDLMGLVGMTDPPRPGVKESIASCRSAGIKVAMITGDHPDTASAIAREIGLLEAGGETLSGRELDALSDPALQARIDRVRVFARTSPEQKLRIVRAIKSCGHVVAMTGDGVNDAPALREAHIGVAMGRGGTEVARQAADLVLADDDFTTILAAVEEGRIIYKNLRKFIFFLLSANAGLCGAVFLAALVRDWPPFTPLMLLWINLVTNGLPALALGVDPPSEDVMASAPRALGEPLLSRTDWAASR